MLVDTGLISVTKYNLNVSLKTSQFFVETNILSNFFLNIIKLIYCTLSFKCLGSVRLFFFRKKLILFIKDAFN